MTTSILSLAPKIFPDTGADKVLKPTVNPLAANVELAMNFFLVVLIWITYFYI